MKKLLVILTGVVLICVLSITWVAARDADKGPGLRVLLKRTVIDTSAGKAFQAESLVPARPALDGKGFYVLQFTGPVDESWKAGLKGMGVKFFSYLPDYAFVVKMAPSVAAAVRARPDVQFVGLYLAGYKLSTGLDKTVRDAMAAKDASEALKPVSLKVKVFDGEDLKPLIAELNSLGGTVEVLSDGPGLNEKTVKVDLPANKVAEVTNIPEVEWVEKYKYAKLLNDVVRLPIILNISTAQVLPGHPLDGAGQVAGLLDTGLDTGDINNLHPAFAGNTPKGQRKVNYRSYRGDKNWGDIMGHGTMVAGAICGSPNDGSGLRGMAPGARLYIQSGQTYSDYLLTPDLNKVVFNEAMHAGVRVHNDSWGTMGGAPGEYDLQCVETDTFTWNHPYFLPVFAAGNDGEDKKKFDEGGNVVDGSDGVVDLGSVTPPATAKNVLTVGASESYRPAIGYTYGGFSSYTSIYPVDPLKHDPMSNNPNGMAAFSSRGPAADGRMKPDVVAPGVWVLSAKSSLVPPSYWPSWFCGYPGFIDNYYDFGVGTSFAAPLASGAGILVRQYYTDMCGFLPSSALIKATLINGARDLTPGQYEGEIHDVFARPDMHQGWGRVDLLPSVYPDMPSVLVYQQDLKGILTSQGKNYTYRVTDNTVPIRVTLAWTDYPGAVGAAKELVNDLDLTVYGPDGNVYHGNRINAHQPNAPWDNPLSMWDATNNVEGVEIPAGYFPVPWNLTVQVNGYNVPEGPQPYALAITGGLGDVRVYSIMGKVVSTSGNTVEGLTVKATGAVLASATTDVNGMFTMGQLSHGKYYLNVYDLGGALLSIRPNTKVPVGNRDANVTLKVQ